MSLVDAIKSLKSEIADQGFREGLVEEIALEWEVNPILLARKFQECTGKAPADFVIIRSEVLTLDYPKIYEEGMARTWRQHPKMFWVDLNPREQESVKALVNRNVKKLSTLLITWS